MSAGPVADPTLLGLLACPVCRGMLEEGASELRCTRCDQRYRLLESVPVFGGEHSPDRGSSFVRRLQYTILGNARVFDFQQAHFGGRPVAAQLAERLRDLGDVTLLDIGAGTGMVAGLVGPETRYLWFDNDERKLQGLLAKQIDCDAVLGDAARLPFRDDAVDWSLMVEVSHHIPDDALHACLSEAARVTSRGFVFVDAVLGPRLRSRAMWQLDLGRFPRAEDDLLARLAESHTPETVERFRGVNHDHLLCVCVPRRNGVANG